MRKSGRKMKKGNKRDKEIRRELHSKQSGPVSLHYRVRSTVNVG